MIGGMNVQMLARSQLGWDLTGSSLAVTLVGVGFAPPMLLFSLFGGVVSDRFDNKNIIQLGQLGVIAITTFIAISIFSMFLISIKFNPKYLANFLLFILLSKT